MALLHTMARARVVNKTIFNFFVNSYRTDYVIRCCRAASSGGSQQGFLRKFMKPRPQPISGYIVLLPEIPTDTEANNPLLCLDDLPKFNSIKPKHAFNAIGKLAINFDYELGLIEKALADGEFMPTDVKSLRDPLEKSLAKLEYGWYTVFNLQHTRFDLNDRMPFLMIEYTYSNYAGQRHVAPLLYKAMKELQTKHSDSMTESERYLVHRYVLEGEMVGMMLDSTKLQRLQNIVQKVYSEKHSFRVKALQETRSFVYRLFHKDEVKDFPTSLKKLMAVEQINPNRGPWDVTLYDHIYEPFMRYCSNESLRKRIYLAYVQRASFVSKSSGDIDVRLNNSEHIEKLRTQRGHLADTLGYETYADMCLDTRSMAGSLDTVLEVIDALHLAGREQSKADVDSLLKFAKEHGFAGEALNLWDIPYWRYQQLSSLGIDDDFHSEVQGYFQLPIVLQGLFKLCSKLFGINIRKSSKEVEKVDASVEFYDVHSENGEFVGSFYLDPYARNSKDISGMIPIRNRSKVVGYTPVANIVFKFHKPMLGRSALLEFADVVEVFRTFGQALRFFLSKAEYADMCAGVEMDTFWLPQAFMELWLYHYPVVAAISHHCDTGKALPSEMHSKLFTERQHLFAYDLMHQLYVSKLDLELHSTCMPYATQNRGSKPFWVDVMRSVWEEFMPVELPKEDWHPCSMRSIFSERYNCQYYSRIWSEMLACDIFSAFLDAGLENTEAVGKLGRFMRETVLEKSGCNNHTSIFRQFMGRDPSIEAMIKQYELSTNYLHNTSEFDHKLKQDSEVNLKEVM